MQPAEGFHDRQSQGILTFKSQCHITVDVNGIGYRVFVPLSTFYELPDEGSPVVLEYLSPHVREDAIHLYRVPGPRREASVFELLLSVNGIGPKLAINVLSGISSAEFVRAVFDGRPSDPDRDSRRGTEDGRADDPGAAVTG
ncbi:MAG: helix-hairpin-helix domain-containing protein [Desulfosudis oleivorans]|nr:helix-hairpin-helix domain-containing protein [Desulfosudis oleivorans]